MIIIKEKKLDEGIDINKIQKITVADIRKFTIQANALQSQRSSPQKVFTGAVLGVLMGAAEALNPMANHWPPNGNRQLQDNVVAVYKNLLKVINDLDTVYCTDYKDSRLP